MQVERRKFLRRRVLKSGTVEFNGAGGISCYLRNLSEGGACLEVESPVGIPQNFVLAIPRDHATHACRLIWKSEHHIGVAFI